VNPQEADEIAVLQGRVGQVFSLMGGGRLSEAESLCCELVKAYPNQPGLAHLLGLLYHRVGKNRMALEEIEKAIALNPNDPEYHNNVGVVLLALGRNEEAVAECSRAVALRQEYPQAFVNLGNALATVGKLQEAIAAYDRAIQIQPDSAEAINNRANILKQLGRLDEAICAYRQATELQPGYVDAHANLGIALHLAGRLREAVGSYEKASGLQPGNAQLWNHLGTAQFELGMFDDSLKSYIKAASLRDVAEVHNNIGLVLQKLDRMDEAIAQHERALSMKADYAEAITALGTAFQIKGNLAEAMALHRRAIAASPDYPESHLNLAFMLLAEGSCAEGWQEYEWRRRRPSGERRFDYSCPEWHGEDLAGKRILVAAEQGLGDAINFVRYVPLLADRGAKVFLECYPELRRLFQTVRGVEGLLGSGDSTGRFDFFCPMLSLPRVFGTELDSIPSEVPYLSADPGVRDHWSERIQGMGAGINVGVAWAGRTAQVNDRNRSIPVSVFSRLGGVPGVRYFSLQKETVGKPDFAMIDLTGELMDMADTAALMTNLDLVITVDSAVGHLAGAIGKRGWILLPRPTDFRWLLEREDTPWYPSIRLYRQARPRDWEEPIGRVLNDLRGLVSNPPRC
jgi:tetratricopeptide (TPR) repeat protein